MKPSPLQLERYFFSKIQLDAHITAEAKAKNTLDCGVEIGEAVDNPRRFQVSLELKLLPTGKETTPYTGEFHAVGFFRVADDWPEERIMQLVEANGPALLYGALREMVISLTSRGPWPALTLESVTFAKIGPVPPPPSPRKRIKVRRKATV